MNPRNVSRNLLRSSSWGPVRIRQSDRFDLFVVEYENKWEKIVQRKLRSSTSFARNPFGRWQVENGKWNRCRLVQEEEGLVGGSFTKESAFWSEPLPKTSQSRLSKRKRGKASEGKGTIRFIISHRFVQQYTRVKRGNIFNVPPPTDGRSATHLERFHTWSQQLTYTKQLNGAFSRF